MASTRVLAQDPERHGDADRDDEAWEAQDKRVLQPRDRQNVDEKGAALAHSSTGTIAVESRKGSAAAAVGQGGCGGRI